MASNAVLRENLLLLLFSGRVRRTRALKLTGASAPVAPVPAAPLLKTILTKSCPRLTTFPVKFYEFH